MEKRYQIFISSTYEDLKEERGKVIYALMGQRYFPMGMEFFNSSPDDQFEFIKTVIDESDYYVLIVADRYGTEASDGKSYTEKEFDYAIERGVPVLAFVKKSKSMKRRGERLLHFVRKVETGRIVKYWSAGDELAMHVVNSVNELRNNQPRTGWVRSDVISSVELLNELNILRKEKSELEETLRKCRAEQALEMSRKKLAGMSEYFNLHYTLSIGTCAQKKKVKRISWGELYGGLAVDWFTGRNEKTIKADIESLLAKGGKCVVDTRDFQKIKIQFLAKALIVLNYAKTVGDGMGVFWRLTELGQQELFSLRAQKSQT